MEDRSVSVIIATRNAEATLERCIHSVLAQQPPVELVVVDGLSNDGTMAIVERHRSSIAHAISERDQSLYDALNKGVRLASGRYVHVLGADDELAHPRALADLLEGGQGADVIYGDVVFRRTDGTVVTGRAQPLARFPLYMPFVHQAVLERRELLLRNPFANSLASDYGHFYGLYLTGAHFRHVPGCVAHFALGGVSDRRAVASTWDRLRINFALRRAQALAVLPYYLAQTAICWLKPKLLRALKRQPA